MHCALYVFYEANKDDYYNKAFGHDFFYKLVPIQLVGHLTKQIDMGKVPINTTNIILWCL